MVNDHKTYDSFDDPYQIARSSSTNSPRAWIVLRATPWPPSSSLRGSSWRSFRICPPLARPWGWHRGSVQQKFKGRSLQKHAVMAQNTSYNWLFLWDYTFYKWGYKYLELIKGHNCSKTFWMPFRCLLVKTSWFPMVVVFFSLNTGFPLAENWCVDFQLGIFFLQKKKHEDFSSKNRALKGVSMVSMCRNLEPT